jgi:hypothetical protein
MKLLVNFINYSLTKNGTGMIMCSLEQYHVYTKEAKRIGLFIEPGGLIVERASPVPCRVRTDSLKICSLLFAVFHKRQKNQSYWRDLNGKVPLQF